MSFLDGERLGGLRFLLEVFICSTVLGWMGRCGGLDWMCVSGMGLENDEEEGWFVAVRWLPGALVVRV